MRNEELLRKADMTIADLSSYGKLNPEQANAFIRKLSVESTVLNLFTQYPHRAGK